jgi:predicted HicB family RNase H-like nuclease
LSKKEKLARRLLSRPLDFTFYVGSLELSERDGVFHGKVIGVKALISFEGDSVNSIIEDFHNAVDEYLKFCADNGKEPVKAFKGSFNVRVGPDLHRKAVLTGLSEAFHSTRW